MEEKAKLKDRPAIGVAAICGSLRKNSTNRGLIRYAIEIGSETGGEMNVEDVDISNLPLINTDLESNFTYPPEVEAFRRKIFEADCILFASPEYNYSIPAPLKNAIDWGSRPPNVFADKTAAIVSAAGGSAGKRMQYHLRQVGVDLDLHFINRPEVFILARHPPNKFDSDGNLVDSEIKEQLRKLLSSLQAFTHRLGRAS